MLYHFYVTNSGSDKDLVANCNYFKNTLRMNAPDSTLNHGAIIYFEIPFN